MTTRPTRHKTSLSTLVMFLLHHVGSLGISESAVRRKLDLKESWLDSLPEQELIALVPRLLSTLQALTKDDLLGLHAGERFHFCLAGAGGLAATHAPTPAIALKTFGCFVKGDGLVQVDVSVDEVETTFRLKVNARWPVSSKEQVIDGFFSSLIAALRPICGSSFELVTVRLSRRKPADFKKLERVFRPHAGYGAEYDELVVRTADLAKASLLYEPLLYEQLRFIADLGATSPSGTSPLRQLVEQAIHGGDQTIECVAETLQIGKRTLQRRLQAEGVTFRDVLSKVRMILAEQLLVETELSITEIAKRLCYSDDKALRKAFKNRTGKTPTEFREH